MNPVKELECPQCGLKVRNISKLRGRFKRRHPLLCTARVEFTKQLAEGTKCVDDEEGVGKINE